MATETLRFVLELYSEFWKRPPKVDIYVNGQSKYSSEITETKDKPHTVDFTHSFTEGDKISLVIDRQNKSSTDTLVENNTIKKDQLLHIKSIAIDEIDIGGLVYEGIYRPEYPEPWATQQRESGNDLKDSFKNVTSMGFDGEWRFTFGSPFYMWLLENLY